MSVGTTYEELDRRLAEAESALARLRDVEATGSAEEGSTILLRLGEVGRSVRAARQQLETRLRHAPEAHTAVGLPEPETRDRQQFEAALRASEDRYQELVRRISSGVAVCRAVDNGSDFLVEEANEAFLHIRQLPKEALVGRLMTEAFPGAAQSGLLDALRRVHQTGQSDRLPIQEYQQDVIARWEEYWLYRLPTAQVAVVCEDSTARKQAERQASQADRVWKDVFHAIGQPAIILDRSHVVIAANKAVRDLTGLPEEALLGRKCYEIFHDRATGCPPSECPAEKLGSSGKLETVEMELQAFGGWYLVTCTPVLDEQGRLNRIIHIATDITAHKLAEQDLVRNRLLLQTVLNSTPDWIFVKDAQHRFVLANRSFADTLGRAPEELIGHPDTEFWPEELCVGNTEKEIRGIRANDDEALAGKTIHNAEDIVTLPDGTTRVFDTYKIPLNDQDGRVLGVLTYLHDLTQRRRTEAALRVSEQRFRAMFEQAAVGVVQVDTMTGRFVQVNRRYCEIVGRTPEELLATTFMAITHPDDLPEQLHNVELFKSGQIQAWSMEKRYLRPDGSVVWVSVTASPIWETGQAPTCHMAVVTDITGRKQAEEERRKLETQFRHAQKMEAIGRLAGGIAHDFNNLLTAIMGYTEVAASKSPPHAPWAADIEQIGQAARRAADLTRQLLAFARKQVVQPRTIDLNTIVTGMERMLHRLIGEDIQLITELAQGIDPIFADPGQIEQVLINMAINARDAMPSGGRMVIETGRAFLDDNYALHHPSVTPGPYSMVSVTDSGIGMPPDVAARLFEPFFTTKEAGKGTGLGLATCYGIIAQAGGHIAVYSEPGVGSTFKVYLPVSTEPAPRTPSAAVPNPTSRGNETVLLVEDEELVRKLAERVLKLHGYNVLVAESGNEALNLASRYAGDIRLLLTDMVMPGRSGKMVSEEIRRLVPGVRVLFMSGYAERMMIDEVGEDVNAAFISKPFTAADLTQKIRRLLDGAPRPA